MLLLVDQIVLGLMLMLLLLLLLLLVGQVVAHFVSVGQDAKGCRLSAAPSNLVVLTSRHVLRWGLCFLRTSSARLLEFQACSMYSPQRVCHGCAAIAGDR